MRSRARYHKAHIKDSINFPVDMCDENFFINWDSKNVEKELIKNKQKKQLFINRKRLFIYIIPAEGDIASLTMLLPMIFTTSFI